MAGSDSQPVQRNNTEPWDDWQPYGNKIMSGAENLYDQGIGANPYPGPTYVPPTAKEMSGLGKIQGIAQGGNPLASGMYDYVTKQLSSGGMTGAIGDVASGAKSIPTDSWQHFFNTTADAPISWRNLGSTAAGEQIGANNQY